MDELEPDPEPTPQRARATLVLDALELEWPAFPRGLARLENLDDAPLVGVCPQCSRGGPVIHVVARDGGEHLTFFAPSWPGGEEPEVVIPPGRAREHAVGIAPPISLPRPGTYAVHVEYAWQGGAARSEPVEVRVRPGLVHALACRGRLGGTASPSECLLVEHARDTSRLRLVTLDHDGPPTFGAVASLGEAPAGARCQLSIAPQALPTRQWVAWVEGRTLHAVTHAHGELGRLAQPLPTDGYRLLGPPVEDRHEPGRLPCAEALLVRETSVGWALHVATLGGERELFGGRPHEGRAPQVAHTVAHHDGRRVTLLLGGDERAPEPYVRGHVVRWQQGRGVDDIEPLPAWPGVLVAAELVTLADRRRVAGAVVTRLPAARVEVHLLSLHPGAPTELGPSRAYALERDVVRGVVQLDARGRIHGVLEDEGGGLHRLGPDGSTKVLALGPVEPPFALVLAEDRVPVLLASEPGVGLRAHALGRVEAPLGPR